MEGLFIAEEVAKISGSLPAKHISWRFPDAKTFVLPLQSNKKLAIWLYSRPPKPRLALENDFPEITNTKTGFQDLLVSKTSGELLSIEQLKLDRVVKFHFAAGQGFVPSPPVTLVFELTGRNCNMILLDDNQKILGAFRDVSSDINRFRQVKVGLDYVAPPPYQKLDPRSFQIDDLIAVLEGKTLKEIWKHVDGIGPELTRALAIASELRRNKKLAKEDIEKLWPFIHELKNSPTEFLRKTINIADIKDLRLSEQRQENIEKLEIALNKKLNLVNKRLEDIQKIREAAKKADEIKLQADLLMAYQYSVPKNASQVSLIDFDGEELILALNPQLSAVENAQKLYKRSQKAKKRKSEAENRFAELAKEQKELKLILASLAKTNDKKLQELAKQYSKAKTQKQRSKIGAHFQGPHGFNIIVGKSSKENDLITKKIARSRDIWLHAQGYRGSHVIIQAKNKEVPFETIVFAAQLAAANSKAGQSENVPVDYTLRKHVWKQKGAALGAVNYAQQKTVYVSPSRNPSLKQLKK
ncbi:MAG TPA: fibronectin-binding domain-containing protein [Trueperaceae bacterium]|nr:fibronectin-binding domain-containing protein [Trueperaceae bacterium]